MQDRLCTHRVALRDTYRPRPPSHEDAAGDGQLLLGDQHHALWDGP